ncbi:MAG: DUF1684 domain-containing protein [Acidobacteriota bacterium]|nr:DUF1684 domain-containing protein [Acidobacteriota bacterium]
MRTKHWLGALVCGVAVGLVGCSAPPPDDSNWLETLEEDREIKDQFFREAPDSPIVIERRGALLPLHYYEANPVYRVPAALEVAPEQPIYEIPTSTGEIRPMQRVGVLEFALDGEPMRLSALAEAPVRSIESLFIMFKDPTNEGDTYAGGRYLDLPRTASGLYDLDFNRAYNPYCYYNEDYDCPYPPRENWLTADVLAGERLAPGYTGFGAGVIPPPPADNDVSDPAAER